MWVRWCCGDVYFRGGIGLMVFGFVDVPKPHGTLWKSRYQTFVLDEHIPRANREALPNLETQEAGG